VIDSLSQRLPPRTRIRELSDTYPAGDEFILVYDVTQRIIPPGKIPLAVGCVVINVETALNIGRRRRVTSKFLTIAGAVRSPCTVEVPIGTSFADCISLSGGAAVRDPVALVGGAMMGKFCDDLSQPVTKTTGGLIVLGRDHPLVHRYTLPWPVVQRIGASACDQCSFCTYFCPRYLLGHPIEPHKAMRSLGFNLVGEPNVIGTQFCCECNLCTMMACPEDLDPKTVCATNKQRLAAEGKRWNTSEDPDRAAIHLDNRRVPIPRLIRKLGLHQFENKGPLIQANDFRPPKVTLPLKQHAGAPAAARVQPGDRVCRGDVVAEPVDSSALGAVIHSSIEGRVSDISSTGITIEA
jgi:Na+-translocating ferredoxin:NAD+ oxidoreductase RnfC subunit